jgi:hypothetical protein
VARARQKGEKPNERTCPTIASSANGYLGRDVFILGPTDLVDDHEIDDASGGSALTA